MRISAKPLRARVGVDRASSHFSFQCSYSSSSLSNTSLPPPWVTDNVVRIHVYQEAPNRRYKQQPAAHYHSSTITGSNEVAFISMPHSFDSIASPCKRTALLKIVTRLEPTPRHDISASTQSLTTHTVAPCASTRCGGMHAHEIPLSMQATGLASLANESSEPCSTFSRSRSPLVSASKEATCWVMLHWST